MVITEQLSLEKKLQILGDAAKYDVACTSSGASRSSNQFSMGNAVKAGLCHSFTADGRCISLLKILMTNECIYNCKYCINRTINDNLRTTFTPEEVAKLTMEFYRRNYIEGLFLSSGVYPTPQIAAERMLEAVKLLRSKYHFGGYIHVKAIPGVDQVTLIETGWLVDRMSVNLECATSAGLRDLAPNKTRNNILLPMRFIQNAIAADKGHLLEDRQFNLNKSRIQGANSTKQLAQAMGGVGGSEFRAFNSLSRPKDALKHFVSAGQSTQMIIGATKENDYQIMSVTEGLYQKFNLKRVFYSAFINVNEDEGMPHWSGRQLLDREHRLYQADFLIRFYKYNIDELLSEEHPNFNMLVDPKCDYALRHLEIFPVEINKATYHQLLRVPGIGVKSAQRIVAARRTCNLDFRDLKKIGVVLKRAVYFITCKGRMEYPIEMTQDNIMRYLVDDSKRKALQGETVSYKQLSLFDLQGGEGADWSERISHG